MSGMCTYNQVYLQYIKLMFDYYCDARNVQISSNSMSHIRIFLTVKILRVLKLY